jgi:hypothetical protein
VTAQSAPNPKVERMLALTQRLTDALKADIAALERGRPREMRTIEPDMQQICALYAREAAQINAALVKTMPAATRTKLSEATKKFREALNYQSRLITRMKNATEGIVRAIATDVERKRSATRPYTKTPAPPSRPANAILYNSVI